MNRTWRLVVDEAAGGALNMARDEAILTAVAQQKSPPTLRVYSWKPPTVTVGYFQRLRKEVDIERCKAAGYDLVRRQTGGRTVLHDDEVTYSVSVCEKDFRGTVLESYKRLSLALVEGLRVLGMDVDLHARSPKKEKSSAACFDAPSWYEIVCQGKKIVGSAQVRKHGAMLQHGSIPITFDAEDVAGILLATSPMVRERLARMLSRHAAGIADCLAKRPNDSEVADAIVIGFERALGIKFEVSGLSEYELELAEHLVRQRYSRDEWNLKR